MIEVLIYFAIGLTISTAYWILLVDQETKDKGTYLAYLFPSIMFWPILALTALGRGVWYILKLLHD